MSAALLARAREKEALLARSAQCRQRLRDDTRELRDSLHWKRLAVAAVSAPGLGRMVLGLALSRVGLSRMARLATLAGRAIVLAKLAARAAGILRKRAKSAKP
jgi:hypothetical protein